MPNLVMSKDVNGADGVRVVTLPYPPLDKYLPRIRIHICRVSVMRISA